MTTGGGCVVVVDYRADPPQKCAVPESFRAAMAVVDGDAAALGRLHATHAHVRGA